MRCSLGGSSSSCFDPIFVEFGYQNRWLHIDKFFLVIVHKSMINIPLEITYQVHIFSCII